MFLPVKIKSKSTSSISDQSTLEVLGLFSGQVAPNSQVAVEKNAIES
jgi:hypothetical protein